MNHRRLKLLFVGVLPVAINLLACRKPESTVVLDSWWNHDYAKQSCRGSAPCVPDPVEAVSEFEDELATQFAADAGCLSLRFARFNGPKSSDKSSGDAANPRRWWLTLDFSITERKQHWKMVSPSHSLYQGSGTPAEIAKQVCSIVNGRGATIAASQRSR
jgi:hypothetical protein